MSVSVSGSGSMRMRMPRNVGTLRRFSGWFAILALLSLVIGPDQSMAQRAKTSELRGRVTIDSRPLQGATVSVLGTDETRLTGEAGGFAFERLPPGRYWISVRRIGYRPSSFTATLEADSVRTVEVVLEPVPYRLKDVEVSSDVLDRYRYYDFARRSRSAWGRFLTRDDIRRIRPVDLVELVHRYLPFHSRWTLSQSSWFDPGPRSSATSWLPSSATGRTCTPGISINGATPWPGASVADYPIEEVEAVEVYRRPGWVPIEFERASACGLVVIWTN